MAENRFQTYPFVDLDILGDKEGKVWISKGPLDALKKVVHSTDAHMHWEERGQVAWPWE